MQIQIESTNTITTVNGTECRHWKGVTAKGTKCEVFVALIATDTIFTDEFEAELHETSSPREFVKPLSDILK